MQTNFYYSATLGDYECPKQVQYHLTKTERLESKAMDIGTDLHKQAELFLKGEAERRILDLPDGFFNLQLLNPTCELELRLDDESFRLKGIIDCITEDGVIYDWKFTSKPWDAHKIAKASSGQGVIYPYLALKNNLLARQMIFFVMPHNQEAQVVEVKFTPESLERDIAPHKARYRQILNMEKNNGFFPEASKWNCRFCHWREACEDRIR